MFTTVIFRSEEQDAIARVPIGPQDDVFLLTQRLKQAGWTPDYALTKRVLAREAQERRDAQGPRGYAAKAAYLR